VLVYYLVAALVLGTVLSVVFQLAHCVEEASSPCRARSVGASTTRGRSIRPRRPWDFARCSRVAAWFLGGLNFQIEHHLFPRISHVNYPAISRVVEETCRDFGVRYTLYTSFRAGCLALPVVATDGKVASHSTPASCDGNVQQWRDFVYSIRAEYRRFPC